MGKPFKNELLHIKDIIEWSNIQDVNNLKTFFEIENKTVCFFQLDFKIRFSFQCRVVEKQLFSNRDKFLFLFQACLFLIQPLSSSSFELFLSIFGDIVECLPCTLNTFIYLFMCTLKNRLYVIGYPFRLQEYPAIFLFNFRFSIFKYSFRSCAILLMFFLSSLLS